MENQLFQHKPERPSESSPVFVLDSSNQQEILNRVIDCIQFDSDPDLDPQQNQQYEYLQSWFYGIVLEQIQTGEVRP